MGLGRIPSPNGAVLSRVPSGLLVRNFSPGSHVVVCLGSRLSECEDRCAQPVKAMFTVQRRNAITAVSEPAETTLTLVTAGKRLGPYEIVAPLGAGGMGQVFKARDTRLGRAVAIKISKHEFDGRFEREARAISALNHPHICTLYDVGPNYLVMELVEGETLAARIRRGPLAIESVLCYGIQIAGALAAAHAQGLIHRDLKPGNVMVTRAGVKVLDFGLAKFAGPAAAAANQQQVLTVEEAVVGTPAYMSPEQARGEALDERSDIFSLGCVLYAAATGRATFRGDNTLAILHQVTNVEPPSAASLRADLPTELDAILHRALAKEKDQRYRSATEIGAALEALRGSMSTGQPLAEQAGGPAGRAPVKGAIVPGYRRHSRVAAIHVIGVVVLTPRHRAQRGYRPRNFSASSSKRRS
jgi:serine/threonine protein kinase